MKPNGMNILSKNKGKSAVPAVEKALDVIELLSASPNGLTMNELAEILGRSMGEIYRIVIYLTERKYLTQNPETSRYTLTLRLFEISHKFEPTEKLLRYALPVLERIAATIHQSCHLGVLNQPNVLVIASVPSPLPAGYSVRVGSFYPLEQTSSGHVILAFSPFSVQDRYIASKPDSDQDSISDRLERIRMDGFEDTPSKMIYGIRNLCVPVFNNRGITAAITSGYIEQIGNLPDASEALKVIRQAAIELSHSLGFQSRQDTS